MGAKQDALPDDAPSWAQMIYDDMCKLRALIEGQQSLAVGTGDAAKILGVSESTLRRLDADGAMTRKINTGKHARYNRADIERMAQARKTGRPRKTAQTS